MFYTKLFESLDQTNEIKVIKIGFDVLYRELGLYRMTYFLNRIGIQIYPYSIFAILEEFEFGLAVEQYLIYYDQSILYKYCRNYDEEGEFYIPYEEIIDDYNYDLYKLKEKGVDIDDIEAKEIDGVKSIIIFIS